MEKSLVKGSDVGTPEPKPVTTRIENVTLYIPKHEEPCV
jgi:hypothetical protein